MLLGDVSNPWYKKAIIYGIDVEIFMDSNGDGVGDFPGLTRRLDYLSGLGVNCLWLMPFYETPNRDNGYDISNYYNIDPRLGNLGDFVEFSRRARENGLRVIIDLVINHTSDEHPWFQMARSDRGSKYHDYYVWVDEPPEEPVQQVIYHGERESVWTYDEQAGQYYKHQFYEFQPDLNFANPDVRDEILKIMGFWLELGISGFRVDAAPYLTGEAGGRYSNPHVFLREMRDFVSARRGDAVFMAETDVEPHELATYFGDGNEMQLLYNFLLNNYVFLALARQAASPLARGLELLPSKPSAGQWANFLRNYDELDLERLGDAERQEVFRAFAPDKDMRIYNHGIRRRLAPILGGDLRRIELAYSLLFTLPGTPLLLYGDEIGMGDDLSLEGRWSVRTPMQWSSEPNAGYSTAPKDSLVRPVIEGGQFGYERVNAMDERRDPDSLLNWMERAIRSRKESSEFGQGEWEIIETGDPAVFAHCCRWQGSTVLAVHNLAPEPRTVQLPLGDEVQQLLELYGDQRYEPAETRPCKLRLGEYGYRWLRVYGLHP